MDARGVVEGSLCSPPARVEAKRKNGNKDFTSSLLFCVQSVNNRRFVQTCAAGKKRAPLTNSHRVELSSLFYATQSAARHCSPSATCRHRPKHRAAARTAAPSARRMSGEAKPPPKPAPVAPKPALAAPKPAARGSSFFERLSAFLVGAGVGAGVGYYHLAKVSCAEAMENC